MRRFDAGEYLRDLGTGLVRLVISGIAGIVGVVLAGIGIYFAADYSAEQQLARDTAEQEAAMARRGYSAAYPSQPPSSGDGWGAESVEAALEQPAR